MKHKNIIIIIISNINFDGILYIDTNVTNLYICYLLVVPILFLGFESFTTLKIGYFKSQTYPTKITTIGFNEYEIQCCRLLSF